MANALPKWVQIRYARLWDKFEEKPFSYADIEKILKLDDNRVISVFLNELKKEGWVSVELDKNDMRKRQYTLKNPQIAIKEMAKNK